MADLAHLTAARLFDVKGRVALVTGGGQGLGLLAALALVSNGAIVYIGGRRIEIIERAVEIYGTAAQAQGGQLIPVQLDVTDMLSIHAVRDRIKTDHGMLNILIGNAGQLPPRTNDAEAKTIEVRGIHGVMTHTGRRRVLGASE